MSSLFVDNWRWHGVPLYLGTGKRRPVKASEMAIQFAGYAEVVNEGRRNQSNEYWAEQGGRPIRARFKTESFPLHPKFSEFRFEPEFEYITTDMKVDHLRVYSTNKPHFRVGQTITIHYELKSDTEA